MKVKKVIMILNLVLVCAMVIHVGTAWYHHTQHMSNSAPAHVTLIYSVYYLIPLAIINVIGLFFRKRK